MYVALALVATVLTSFLPIVNKRLVRDARPALVAWAVNAASLPLLASGTIVLTQCRITPSPSLVCLPEWPQVDLAFLAALLASSALNWAAMLLSTHALAEADASLVSPLLTFNPAFTLFVAWVALGETPGLRQGCGVAAILLGTYLLETDELHAGVFAPIRALMRRRGARLAVLAGALWGITTVLEKVAIEHVNPPSGPLVALVSTAVTVALLTPGAFRVKGVARGTHRQRWAGIIAHRKAFIVAALIAGLAPLFGFSAIALGLVGYVTALFKLSAVLTIVWARLFLGEGKLRQRVVGACVMVIGGVLIAA